MNSELIRMTSPLETIREQAAIARFASENLTPCQGTQDNVPISWLFRPYPRGFDRLVAKRAGCTLSHVRDVSTNRFCSSWTPLLFGVWDWRVCRAAMEILHEFDESRYWIEERHCARQTKLSLAAIRCLASNGHVQTRKSGSRILYFREDVGLPLGLYRRSFKASFSGRAE